MNFDKKVVIITGGGQGIGETYAKSFAAAGASVVIAELNEEGGQRVADEICQTGGKAAFIKTDVSSEENAAAAAKFAKDTFGGIDILVNNAGMQHRTALQDFPPEAFEQLLQTNIASVFHVGQAVARHMIGRERGKIINIASVQSALARPGIAPYTATKGAVTNLTKGMATDWAKHGLQCNAIAPGYFDTPLNAALVADPEFSAWLTNRTPAGRWGQVEELVGACIFLASDASSFVNGHTLYVDGGITASL